MSEKENNNIKHCPNCGAPMTSEVCPYCKNFTGLDTATADMEYPVIECKEANIGSIWFPLIFALGFGFFGFVFPIIMVTTSGDNNILFVLLFCSLFGIVGIAAFVIVMVKVIRVLLVKFKGKEIETTVYGYMNDNLFINDAPAQIVKLLVQTDEGSKFILYQLEDTKKPYKVNSKIKLSVYKDVFMIKKDKKTYF